MHSRTASQNTASQNLGQTQAGSYFYCVRDDMQVLQSICSLNLQSEQKGIFYLPAPQKCSLQNLADLKSRGIQVELVQIEMA